MNDEINELLYHNKCFYKLILGGMTSYYQPLNLYINKLFKDYVKTKYREICITYKNTKKCENLIKWFSDIWWSNKISKDMVKLSFKKESLNPIIDGSRRYVIYLANAI